jgi:uncharacterized protein
MSRLFSEPHRSLQDAFGTRGLADRIEELACATAFDELATGFIQGCDMFFLATVDPQGRPTVSYKGGAPGFVQVLDDTTLAFPSYDGNGMYLSMGNLSHTPEVGLLFISFEKPHRIRVQGRASLSREPADLARFPGAELVVRVGLSELWQNCPRYIHRYRKEQPSRYVPDAAGDAPLAEWKRIDLVQDVLPAQDVARAAEAGPIGIEEWMGKVMTGDPEA